MPIYLIFSHLGIALLALWLCKFFKTNKPLKELSTFNSSALISDEATKNLVDRYYQNIDNTLLKKMMPEYDGNLLEARLAWVSFADLKNYMQYIQTLSHKNGFGNTSNLGLNLYYGRYPENAVELSETYNKNGTIGKDFKGRHTLVMVPTFKDGEIQRDFNPHFIEKGRPKDIHDIRKNEEPKHAQGKQQTIPNADSALVGRGTANNGITTSNTTSGDTNVNLNSFGIMPPRPNDGEGAAYLAP